MAQFTCCVLRTPWGTPMVVVAGAAAPAPGPANRGGPAGTAAKGPTMAKRTTTTNTPQAPVARSTGATRAQAAATATSMRHAGNSWAAIGQALGVAPRTARALYQQANGAHSHHGTLPGKGGRYPVGYVAPAPTAAKVGTAPVAPWAPGAGTGVAGTMGGSTPPAPAPAAKRTRKAASKG